MSASPNDDRKGGGVEKRFSVFFSMCGAVVKICQENAKCHHENVRCLVYLVPEMCADLAILYLDFCCKGENELLRKIFGPERGGRGVS
jgi:hypothetical protein